MASSPARPSPAVRILDTANRLFYDEGFRVGIDRVISESKVAKASFYRAYPSKDDLIVAVLRRRHEEWTRWFVRRVDALTTERGRSLVRLADALGEWFARDDFRGSPFTNAMADASLPRTAVEVVHRHDEALRRALLAYLEHVGLEASDEVADQVSLIVEGAIVRAQRADRPDAAAAAARAAASLLARLDRPV
ncbi:TetR/AcrR family transcriptional regulator [Agromyces intestinalis]|uniref:TetR/AcrR family transcriptional regulator n=1 Tax=Agromyces intestinalis TaxID=2592652 RepID=UPI00143D00E4|nr:TetR/AcrR family transcriptional regulator [Agromyces intestinalis]